MMLKLNFFKYFFNIFLNKMQSNFPCNCYPRQHAGNCASNELRYKARSIYQQVPLKQIIHFGGYVRPEEKEKADA